MIFFSLIKMADMSPLPPLLRSYRLSQELLSRGIAMQGTIMTNRREVPPAFKKERNKVLYNSLFGFRETATLVSYAMKKGEVVNLLSTVHRDDTVGTGDKRKPAIVEDYNRCKAGVDTLDQVGTFISTISRLLT